MLGPFAIVLAFPFYWALTTMFKRDLDLYNADLVPYTYNRSTRRGTRTPTGTSGTT